MVAQAKAPLREGDAARAAVQEEAVEEGHEEARAARVAVARRDGRELAQVHKGRGVVERVRDERDARVGGGRQPGVCEEV